MKKLFSILFVLLLMCSAAAPAFAATDPDDTPPANAVHEYCYWYVIEQTEDGPAFSYLRYFQDEDDPEWYLAYIPKTLGGITLTPENFNGSVFYPCSIYSWYLEFEVDDDNEFFTLIDGVLFSKDGSTLICFPWGEPYDTICRIPDGTTRIADGPICDRWNWIQCDCFVFPGSVTDVNAETFAGFRGTIAANADSAAQRAAEANDIPFIPLDKEHTHVYFHEQVYDWDAYERTNRLICPCGDVLETQTVQFGHGGDPTGSCTCMCHQMRSGLGFTRNDSLRTVLQKLLYCIRRMFWQLLGIRQTCACGARHW